MAKVQQPAWLPGHRTDVTLPRPDAIPSDQPCWLPGMSKSSFLPSLAARHRALICDKSFPMMRRLFDAIVRPTISCGCEVWAPACSLASVPQLKDMQGIQVAFFRQLCQLRKSITPHIIFREREREEIQLVHSASTGL